MIYELKHYNTTLVRFSVESGAEPNVRILWSDSDRAELLPLDMEKLSEEELESWVRHRTIPRNRAYVDTILSKMGLSGNRPFDILRVSKGLSLNDCYWVTEEGFDGTFERYNLYDNPFSRVLGEIAFTGFGSSGNVISSSPEYTTNGALPKCWRRDRGVIKLYKGGTSGASNTGNEPYSEFYASQLAQILGFNAIKYELSKWKGTICSTCELFTSKEYSFVPVGRLVRRGGMNAVRKYCAELGEEFTALLDDMIIFDAVILNTDRHYGNFGFLVDNKTNKIVAPAPLFDHGNSLLNFAGKAELADEKSIMKYAATLQPCVYDGFIDTAKQFLNHERREGVRKMLDVRLKRHSKYNLPSERLSLLETVIHNQARRILE